MSTKMISIIAGIVLLVFAGITFLYDMGVDNREVELRAAGAAAQKANEARFDEVWKTIKQVANVTDKYATDFKEIYAGMMDGRYAADSKSNPMFKFIKEQNPQVDSAMYTKLANTITAQRAGFTRDQKKLIDIKREHTVLITRKPSKWFINDGIEALDIVVVTSGKTKETFATGEENDIEMF